MEWIYPEEGQTWEEGEEIVAEYDAHLYGLGKTRYVGKLVRFIGGWAGKGRFYDKPGRFEHGSVKIIAYMPYTKPEPPEKPQDCPFCGARMVENQRERFWYSCHARECCFMSPERKTRAEAIKALNSQRGIMKTKWKMRENALDALRKQVIKQIESAMMSEYTCTTMGLHFRQIARDLRYSGFDVAIYADRIEVDWEEE